MNPGYSRRAVIFGTQLHSGKDQITIATACTSLYRDFPF
jgi:hypothetical protein